MRLKCFGGPYDQKYQWVEDYSKQGDYHRIPRCLPTMSANTNAIAADKVEYTCDLYKIQSLRSSKREWKFLLHEDTSIEELFDKIFA